MTTIITSPVEVSPEIGTLTEPDDGTTATPRISLSLVMATYEPAVALTAKVLAPMEMVLAWLTLLAAGTV